MPFDSSNSKIEVLNLNDDINQVTHTHTQAKCERKKSAPENRINLVECLVCER